MRPHPHPLPELLAPAGTLECGVAAIHAGADAVYAGLQRFNARDRAGNFSVDSLARLVSFAHAKGRQVYVTLNTLVKSGELTDVAAILADLAVFRPDAVIVQDLGVVRMIREHFPVLSVHASTQMGIHNSAGAQVAERMGIKRVILERQTTFEEIARIRRATNIELEVFVHGALCCSLSGACLFSSWMGGWSGNRGRCKQPCRRRYFSPEGNGFFFSTGDLYSLDAIPELKRLGVASLKIEGRLRDADHVSRVVTAHRRVLDAPDPGFEEALQEAKTVLAGALGRKRVRAFRSADDMRQAIRHRNLPTAGIPCGKVLRTDARGFTVSASRVLRTGDTIRIQPPSGEEGPSITVTRMTLDGKPVRQVRSGQQCRVHCDKRVELHSVVIKTAEAGSSARFKESALPAPRPALDIHVAIGADRLDVTTVGGRTWEHPLEVQPARKHAVVADTVADEFRRTRSEKLSAGTVSVTLPDGVFIPASQLKSARRAFWEWANECVDPAAIRAAWDSAVAAVGPQRSTVTAEPCETVVRTRQGDENPVSGALTARDLRAGGNEADEIVLPEFCAEGDLEGLRSEIRRAVAAGRRRFRITSLYALSLIDSADDVRLTATFPLPVCNRVAAEELQALGCRKVTAWVELEERELKQLVEDFGTAVEVLVRGRLPILSTRFELPVRGRITDARGSEFDVAEKDGLTRLYPAKVFAIPVPQGASLYYDLTRAGLDDESTSTFNYLREML